MGTDVLFGKESIQTAWPDMAPLFEKHDAELSVFKDIPLNPNRYEYQCIEAVDRLRIYTARIDTKLIGYALFFLSQNLHYSDSYQAVQDVLFIDPEYRGFGKEFILYCDDDLKEEGIAVVYQSSGVRKDIGLLLNRIGYEKVETVYARRLN